MFPNEYRYMKAIIEIVLLLATFFLVGASQDERRKLALSSEHLSELPHYFKWKQLSDQELNDWYTPADLCVLENGEIGAFPQDIRSRNCSEFSKGSRRMFCGVGMGNNNYPCYGPFSSARPSFKRGMVGYTDSTKKPLLEALSRLLDNNAVLVFLGDSTMRQKLQAFECELRREDPRVKCHGNLFGILPCDTALKVHLPDGRATQMYAISMGPKSIGCLKDGLGEKAPGGGVFENPAHIIKEINMKYNRSVVVIANMGLWYNEESVFLQSIPSVMEWLNSISGTPSYIQPGQKIRNVIAWHETVSQHWISYSGSGYFHKTIVDEQEKNWPKDWTSISLSNFLVPNTCVHITNTSYMADWRNDIVYDIVRANPEMQKNIAILPLASITRYFT